MTTSSESKQRHSGRTFDQMRPIAIELDIQRNVMGSALISTGHTRVICSASVEDRVPNWLRNKNKGWVTAEYSMLPGSGSTRISRRQSGRGTEIQRLIGRSLRSVIDLHALPGMTITLDCDVLDADGGTRTASITGAWVALHLACQRLVEQDRLAKIPITNPLGAVSVGIVGGRALLDLDYKEDLNAEVDMNIVASSKDRLVEVQGTAEGALFSRAQLDEMLDLALSGIAQLQKAQREALGLEG